MRPDPSDAVTAFEHNHYVGRRNSDRSISDDWQASSGRYENAVTACSCGWIGKDLRSTTDTAAAREASYTEWDQEHFGPMVNPINKRVLRIGRDGEIELDNQVVKRGAVLELLLPGDKWLPVRVAGIDKLSNTPALLLSIGGPWERNNIDVAPDIYATLPPNASLRWPVANSDQ